MAKRSFARAGARGKPRTFFIVAAIILLTVLLAFSGLRIPAPGSAGYLTLRGARDIRFGIDIRGGVEAIFAPKDFDGRPTDAQMEAATNVINTRLDNLQILDREVTTGSQNGHVIVRFPWKSDETDFNPDKALTELGEMAYLSFRNPQGEVVIDGAHVKSATVMTDTSAGGSGQPVVQLELNDEGAKKFADETARLYAQYQAGNFDASVLSINMDDTKISAPRVQAHITNGIAIISGSFTIEEAVDLAQKIQAGALPFGLTAINSSTISPRLGQDSLRVMLLAGAVAFALICLFMLLYYRLPGLVACFSLTAQVSGILLAIAIPQQTLTLQGIAGIILSIGMGVDANVIISERIKEELNTGASLPTSISNGFTRAFSSVLDGNVTVAIAAIVLMIFGSGTMLSFGYSLLTGVILNGITGVWLTRLMIGSLSSIKSLQNPVLYGKKRR